MSPSSWNDPKGLCDLQLVASSTVQHVHETKRHVSLLFEVTDKKKFVFRDHMGP